MPDCHHCGRETQKGAGRCDFCGADQPIIPAYPPQQAQPWAGGEDETYLAAFTWAPGCGWYFFSRAMVMFLLISIGLQIVELVLEFQESEMNRRALTAGQEAMMFLSWLGLLAAQIGLLVWAGIVGRRLRWERLTWRDFNQFRQNEDAWGTAGLVGWILIAIAVVIGFFIGLLGGSQY